MLEVIRTTREVQVNETDIISLKEAAKISNRKIPSIGNLLDRGVLPWFELAQPEALKSQRVQRYTSRKAVEALGRLPDSNDKKAGRPRKTKPAKR